MICQLIYNLCEKYEETNLIFPNLKFVLDARGRLEMNVCISHMMQPPHVPVIRVVM